MPEKREEKITVVAPEALYPVLIHALDSRGFPTPSFHTSSDKEVTLFIVLAGTDKDKTPLSSFAAFQPPFKLGDFLDKTAAFFENGLSSRQRGQISIGPYVLLPSLCLMIKTDGRPLRLTEKEAAILLRLHGAEGRVVEKHVLLQDVWGYSAALETHTLETHIYRLRQKIETNPAAPLILLTEEPGYRLG